MNPHLLRAHYGKVYNPKSPGGKFYCGSFSGRRGTRRYFKTATQAKAYAERILIRWRRLFDVKVNYETR